MDEEIKQIQNLKKELIAVMEKELHQLPAYLQKIESPEKRLAIVLKLLPYVFPKMGQMEAYQYDWHSP
ncbi:MAG: hypothetical protein AAF985_23000 [Bacteroidota bacterium]